MDCAVGSKKYIESSIFIVFYMMKHVSSILGKRFKQFFFFFKRKMDRHRKEELEKGKVLLVSEAEPFPQTGILIYACILASSYIGHDMFAPTEAVILHFIAAIISLPINTKLATSVFSRKKIRSLWQYLERLRSVIRFDSSSTFSPLFVE